MKKDDPDLINRENAFSWPLEPNTECGARFVVERPMNSVIKLMTAGQCATQLAIDRKIIYFEAVELADDRAIDYLAESGEVTLN